MTPKEEEVILALQEHLHNKTPPEDKTNIATSRWVVYGVCRTLSKESKRNIMRHLLTDIDSYTLFGQQCLFAWMMIDLQEFLPQMWDKMHPKALTLDLSVPHFFHQDKDPGVWDGFLRHTQHWPQKHQDFMREHLSYEMIACAPDPKRMELLKNNPPLHIDWAGMVIKCLTQPNPDALSTLVEVSHDLKRPSFSLKLLDEIIVRFEQIHPQHLEKCLDLYGVDPSIYHQLLIKTLKRSPEHTCPVMKKWLSSNPPVHEIHNLFARAFTQAKPSSLVVLNMDQLFSLCAFPVQQRIMHTSMFERLVAHPEAVCAIKFDLERTCTPHAQSSAKTRKI